MPADPSADVEIAFQPTSQGWPIKALSNEDRTPRTLIVATGATSDPLAQAALCRWRGAQVLPPVGGANRLGKLLMRKPSADWESVTVHAPGGAWRIRINRHLISAPSVWSVTNLDRVFAHGPFVLDQVLSHVHPVDRERILARPDRDDVIADLNLARRIDGCLIGASVPSGLLTVSTTDRIAAELFALALADERRDRRANLAGPWEERVVQRATELELGIQIPDQIHLSDVADLPQSAREVVQRVALRIGMSPP